MTTLIFVGRGRVDILTRCMDSLVASDPKPEHVAFVTNEDPASDDALLAYPGVMRYPQAKNIGFWGGINYALQHVELHEPFCYFGQDVIFERGWLKPAAEVFSQNFPSGLGLLTFRDDIQNGLNASHGMTTRRWLQVLYGKPFFPSEYEHYFCDSETTARSKSLGRYTYVQEAYVAHKHEPSGFASEQERANIMGRDKTVEGDRYNAWIGGEEYQARLRWQQMEAQR